MTGKRSQYLKTATLLAAALCAPYATSQTQVQQGDALDANQQVGSGGYNRPAAQIDYRARNLLITGQVGGGRAFQGQVDYGADGAFRGNLGSDDLFRFRANSINSAPAGVNFATRELGSRVIVSEATTALPGFRVNTGNALSTRSTFDPGSGVLTYRQSGGGLIAVSGLTDTSQLSSARNSLGLIRTPQGLVSVDASPLTGIQFNPLQSGNALSPDRFRLPGTTAPQPAEQAPQADNPSKTGDDQQQAQNRSLSQTLRIDGKYRPTPGGELPPSGLVEDPLTLRLGTQVQSALALQLAGREDNNIPDTQAQSIRQQVFGQTNTHTPSTGPDQPPKPEQSPYQKLINDILANAKGQTPQADEDGIDWEKILEKPKDALLEAKLAEQDTAMRLTLGLVDDNGQVDYEAEVPSIDEDSALGKLIAELDYDLPRVVTLRGKDESRINRMIGMAEERLGKGDYVNAESAYRQVLREAQDQPLAKAGLIHSQMGAGMIRSAAFNLRDLFNKHPELIALRYDPKLMPETDRLRWLQDRLQKLINDETARGADPGLVLAYLGYQLKADPLVEFGLAVAEADAPRDPLMPILRRIWIEGEDAAEKEDN